MNGRGRRGESRAVPAPFRLLAPAGARCYCARRREPGQVSGPFSIAVMQQTRQIFAYLFLALGLALVVSHFMGGAWPLTWQLVSGLLLVGYGVLRLRYF